MNTALTLILAEDDEGHANLVQRNLKRAGFVNEMIHVKDGQEALDYLGGDGQFVDRVLPDYVLLLLDINMPRVDGIEVLRRIKSAPETSMIPVIMLTTTDDPREVERCYDLGCSVYLTKPVEYDGFIEAINRLGLFLQVVKVPRNGGSH
ncbi:response regulator [Tundrisphaera lichenicola]|uniref:response regulator n=1 Tax=Tundrisphaera lichenicola TaxID=2029860 RepID=UPI003EC15104